MGRLTIIAPLLFVISGFPFVPNASCQNVAKDAKHDQKASKPNLSPVNQQPSPATQQGQAPSNVQPGDKQYPVAVKEMPPKESWDKVYVVLTGALVGVGILTFIAVWRQAVHTRRAADAARDSIKLQELGYTQWVDLKNWRVNRFGPVTEDGVHVNVNFDIVNPTTLPLTVTRATVLSALGTDRSTTIGTPNFLAPGRDYSSGLNIHLPDARVDSLGEVVFTPVGQTSRILVEYEDVRKREFSQEFEVFCAAKSRSNFDFIPSNVPVPKPLPERKKQPKRQNPN